MKVMSKLARTNGEIVAVTADPDTGMSLFHMHMWRAARETLAIQLYAEDWPLSGYDRRCWSKLPVEDQDLYRLKAQDIMQGAEP